MPITGVITSARVTRLLASSLLSAGLLTCAPFGLHVSTDNATDVSANVFHACAVTTDGAVKCWGSNNQGALGDGSGTNHGHPVDVKGLGGGVTSVAVGSDFSCAVTEQGTVKCWGSNIFGTLGDGTRQSSDTPIPVTGLTHVSAITAGSDHVCALTVEGGVKCWGEGRYGQLGSGTGTGARTPVDVQGLTSGVAAIDAGLDATCALLDTGGVKCWGFNWYGEVGDGTFEERDSPVDVVGLTSGVVAISIGTDHACALTDEQEMKCWGANDRGGLGIAPSRPHPTPITVPGLGHDIASVAAGEFYSCAVTSGGAARCWGLNDHGQLGDGSHKSRSTPHIVRGLRTGVAAISAGEFFVCALMTDGHVRCWGSNHFRQAGNNTRSLSLTRPSVVKGFGLALEE